MKNLQMSLKTKWFEMTKAGIKKEDYREITPYWCNRFLQNQIKNTQIHWAYILKMNSIDFFEQMSKKINSDCFRNGGYKYKNKYETNTMTLGYPKKDDTERIIKFKHAGIEIRNGNPEWGAEPDKLYFVIKHGEKII